MSVTNLAPARIEPDLAAPDHVPPAGVRPPHPALVVAAVGAGAVVVGAAVVVGPLTAIAVAVAAAAGISVVVRPVLAVLIVVALVPVLAGVQRGVPVPGLRISEVIVLALLGSVLVTGWAGWRPRWSSLEWATLGYTVATVVFTSLGATVNAGGVGPGLLASLLLPVQFLLLTRVVSITLVTRRRREAAIRTLLVASVPVSAITILQYLDVGPVRDWTVQLTGSDALGGAIGLGFATRATGPFDHWHVLAGYLLPILMLGVAVLLEPSGRMMRTRSLVAILALASIALATTLTFTAAFGLLVGLTIVAVRAGRLATLLRGAAVALVLLVGLVGPSIGDRLSEQFESRPDRPSTLVPETVGYRFDVWSDQFLPAAAESPLIGYGPELPDSITWVYSESLYIGLQLRGGFPLVIAFAALVWAFLAAMARPLRARDPSVRVPAQVVTAVTVVLIPMHAVFPYFASPGLPHLLWLIAGIALAGPRRGHEPVGDAAIGPATAARMT